MLRFAVFAIVAIGHAAAFSAGAGGTVPFATTSGAASNCVRARVKRTLACSLSMSNTPALKSIIVDEESMLKEQNFALAPAVLIQKSKNFLESRGGFGADPALLADTFQFMGPVVRHVHHSVVHTHISLYLPPPPRAALPPSLSLFLFRSFFLSDFFDWVLMGTLSC